MLLEFLDRRSSKSGFLTRHLPQGLRDVRSVEVVSDTEVERFLRNDR